MTKESLIAMRQAVNMCAEAYEAGKEAARNPRNCIEIPSRYSTPSQQSAYVDGFTAMRESMATSVAAHPARLILMPAQADEGVMVKAADCG